MGTSYTVKVVDLPPSLDSGALEQEISDILGSLNSRMSTYDADSELSRFNLSQGTGWFDVSEETATVVGEALRIGALTGGAFDVTVGPLVNLWSFGPAENHPGRTPPDEKIQDALGRVGYQNVDVRRTPPRIRKKRPDVYLDLSGIAKGYAADAIAAHLERRKLHNYMVDIGGEIKANGYNNRGEAWRIAVESPVAGTREIRKVIALKNLAVATSGDYRNYFEQDGVRYSHIIDPRSGRPVSHRLASVTAVHASCMTADALATALLVLGPDKGYDLAAREDLAVLCIVKTDKGFVEKTTPAFQKLLK
jgi:thiamine biosynthesis lipoprotein